jgi:hypothetical protein
MSAVSSTFSKSKTNQIIMFILKKYGAMTDYDEVIDTLVVTPDTYDKEKGSTLIKPSKGKANGPTNPTNSTKNKRGQSKWTAFQKWCKIFGVIKGYKLNRATTKAIWEAEGESWQKQWESVAKELDKGIDIRDVENKPDIEPIYRKVHNIGQESEISEPESQESQVESEDPEIAGEIAELQTKLDAVLATKAAA